MAVMAWGTAFYGHSVYMDALTREHGWTSSLISSAILTFWLASLPGTLTVGLLVDRFGPAIVVAIGGLCIGGGLCFLGTVREPWQLYCIYAAMGFGYPALAGAAISATLAPLFDRGFGVALGIALTGASVGGALLPPFIVQANAAHGFGSTMPLIGLGVLLTAAVIVVVLGLVGGPRVSRQDAEPVERYSMRAVIVRPIFWLIAVPVALGLGGQVGFLAHQIPIIAMQTEPVTAAFMVTVVAIASAIGRLLVGLASRTVSISAITCMTYVLHGTGIGLLTVAETVSAISISCAVIGLTVGAIVMLPPIIVRQVFGTNGFGRTYAMMNVFMYIVAGLSPWLVGLLRDANGNYQLALWLLVVMEAAAAGLILVALRNTDQAAPQ